MSPLKGEGWETWGRPSYPPKGGRPKSNNPRKSPFKGDLEGLAKGDLEGPTERSCLRHSILSEYTPKRQSLPLSPLSSDDRCCRS